MISRWSDRALIAFNDWFTSRAGVWHTLVIVAAMVALEHLCPRIDPSNFLLLYWLTIYSAVTQPALACTGRESADRLEAIQRQQATLLTAIQVYEEREVAALERIEQRKEVER